MALGLGLVWVTGKGERGGRSNGWPLQDCAVRMGLRHPQETLLSSHAGGDRPRGPESRVLSAA